jgi:hypothetical protein
MNKPRFERVRPGIDRPIGIIQCSTFSLLAILMRHDVIGLIGVLRRWTKVIAIALLFFGRPFLQQDPAGR